MPIKRRRGKKGTSTGYDTRNTTFEDGSRNDSKPRARISQDMGVSTGHETRTSTFEDGSSKDKNLRMRLIKKRRQQRRGR